MNTNDIILSPNEAAILSRVLNLSGKTAAYRPPLNQSVTKNTKSHPIRGYMVQFFNRGQSCVLIDRQILIEPGGYYREWNVSQDFELDFLPNPNAPDANIPKVYPNNMLKIRIHKNRGGGGELYNPPPATTLNAGDIQIDPVEYTAGVAAQGYGDRVGNFNFPDGAYKVKIWVITFGETIIVNGDEIVYGQNVFESESFIDNINNVQDFLGVINVLASGVVEWGYNITYPSSSGVNVNAL